MLLHLITSDMSAFRLLDQLDRETSATASCVVIPANRIGSTKVNAVIEEAAARRIPVAVHRSRSAFDPGLPAAEFAVSWMYSQIIRPDDLARYSRGTLNMHGGRIPEYRGANVLQWAIINGDSDLGVTWHGMVKEVDAGPIWAESTVPIALDATAWNVRELMIEKGIEMFPLALRNMLSNSNVRVLDTVVGKVWPARRPEDGRIGLRLSARKVRDLVRALCPPWPSASLEIEGRLVPVTGVSSEPIVGAHAYVTAEGSMLYLQTRGSSEI
jgi:methionyl-tRNA formyltransferase